MTHSLCVLFGAFVGLATGISGAGGSLLAIPLLVSVLDFAPRDAIATSLAATGVSCLVGVIPRLIKQQIAVRLGLVYALAGILGAPGGVWFATVLPEQVILAGLAAVMLLVAVRMLSAPPHRGDKQPSAAPKLGWIPVMGLITGFMSGTFGVGCGFLIVPALALFAQISMQRAVATTLFVMAIVTTSAAGAHFTRGHGLSQPVQSSLFVAAAAAGVLLGGCVAERLSDVLLRRIFAGIILVAATLLVCRVALSLIP